MPGWLKYVFGTFAILALIATVLMVVNHFWVSAVLYALVAAMLSHLAYRFHRREVPDARHP